MEKDKKVEEKVVEEENILEENKKVKVVRVVKEKSVFSRIINVVLWIILIAWMGIVVFDYYNVTQEKEPTFCLKEETIKYDDGNVESCTGLGYKVYKYNRKSYKAFEFGPFWIKDRSAQPTE